MPLKVIKSDVAPSTADAGFVDKLDIHRSRKYLLQYVFYGNLFQKSINIKARTIFFNVFILNWNVTSYLW